MKVAVIIPVGPGHEQLANDAVASVATAWRTNQGPFTELAFAVMRDHEGKLGRSRARNLGMQNNPADFHFLLDADDRMLPETFSLVDLAAPATFGAVMLERKISVQNVWPCTRDTLFEKGARGTLSMGCFIRGDLGLRFNEQMDVAEDYDFYMRLPGFTKIRAPLVSIGYKQPSARGPRGYFTIDWCGECEKVIARYAKALV